jgi:hypothetical protein
LSFQTSSLKRYREVYNLREVTSSCKVRTEAMAAIYVHGGNQALICVLWKVYLFVWCFGCFYLPCYILQSNCSWSNLCHYFLQEELIPAVAQHFAAQVWSVLPLKLFMLFKCGSKLVQIADFLFTISLLIATISGCGGKWDAAVICILAEEAAIVCKLHNNPASGSPHCSQMTS